MQKAVTLGSSKPTSYLKPKEMTPGQSVEGVFRNTFENEEYGTLTHYIEGDAETIGINGSGHLNALLKRVPFNTSVKIVYLGKDSYQNKKGREVEAHQFDVFIPDAVEQLTLEAAAEAEESSKTLED